VRRASRGRQQFGLSTCSCLAEGIDVVLVVADLGLEALGLPGFVGQFRPQSLAADGRSRSSLTQACHPPKHASSTLIPSGNAAQSPYRPISSL